MLNRRRFMQLSVMALSGIVVDCTPAKNKQSKLPIPPLLESKRGQPLFLTFQQTDWSFLQHKKTQVWGINGQYLGPTIRTLSGQDIKIVYTNHLIEPVAITMSGLQLPAFLMGGRQRLMARLDSWSPVLPIQQNAATCWYHANTPYRMGKHVYYGLAGLWIIEDDFSKNLTELPHQYGIDDIPVIIQDKKFGSFGEYKYSRDVQEGFFGNQLIANGVVEPFIEVARGWIRLRLLNASNARHYNLRFSDNSLMHLIANDLSFLSEDLAVNELLLAPGERKEILVDMSDGHTRDLLAVGDADLLAYLRHFFDETDQLLSNRILTIKTTRIRSFFNASLPDKLILLPDKEPSISNNRKLVLSVGQATVNGKKWDPQRIDFNVKQGTWERWHIVSDQQQAFHIQGGMFFVRHVNRQVAPLSEQGWKDTVWLDNEVEIDIWFNQPSKPDYPFLFYSQILEIADRGLMGQFTVTPTSS